MFSKLAKLANSEMIRYEFGDGRSAFIFFKDKGGKDNHMVARVKIEGKF